MSEKYFLGAMTDSGFSTQFFDMANSTEYFTFILKGGAGTGKSTLMKKVADYFENSEDVTRFYCSSDPSSLDAVVLNGSKIIVCDGTAPHVTECTYPGVCQKIINLGERWDENKLAEHKNEIIKSIDENKSLLARSKRFTTALTNVCFDSYYCSLSSVDDKKLNGCCERMCRKILGKKGSGSGKKYVRQLTVLSEFGCLTQLETIDDCMSIYKLCDDYFSASAAFINKIADICVSKNYDVILCPSAAFGNSIYEHLIIPELSVAFVSDTPITKLDDLLVKQVIMKRFYNKEKLSVVKPRLRLDRSTEIDLCEEIYNAIKKAKSVHDEIETYYIEAMDFDGLNDTFEDVLSQIKAKIN